MTRIERDFDEYRIRMHDIILLQALQPSQKLGRLPLAPIQPNYFPFPEVEWY